MTYICQFHLKSACWAPPVCRGGHVRVSQLSLLTLGNVLSCETSRTWAKPPSSKCLCHYSIPPLRRVCRLQRQILGGSPGLALQNLPNPCPMDAWTSLLPAWSGRCVPV